ncbi:hypothetical protein [Phormidesmis priestleyi]
MLKLRVSLAIVLSTTILGGVLLSASASPCPYSKSNSTAIGSRDNPDVPFGKSSDPGRSTDSNPSSSPIQANLNSFSSPSDPKIAGAGLLAIASFLGLGLVQKARRKPDAQLDEMLAKHPEFEHPELMLTGIPREGCACEKADLSIR